MIEPGSQRTTGGQAPAASLTSVVIRRDGDAGARRQDPSPASRREAGLAVPASRQETAAAPDRMAGEPGGVSLTPPGATADIHAYWMGLKEDEALPAWSALDPQAVLDRWPNSVLLVFPDGVERPRPDSDSPFARALRDAKARHADHHPTEMTHSPQMTEWMLSLGQEAARRVRPVHDREIQPSLNGNVRFCAVALPFGDERGGVERVLCHIWRERS